MLDTIKRMASDYYDAIPNDIPRTVSSSALFSFTVSILFTKRPDGVIDISRAFIAAGVAATASIIHALVTPMFKELLGPVWHKNSFAQLAQMTCVNVIASGLMHAVHQQPSTTFPVYFAYSVNWFRALLYSNFQNTENSEYIYINT